MGFAELWVMIAATLGVEPTTASLLVGFILGLFLSKWISFSSEIEKQSTLASAKINTKPIAGLEFSKDSQDLIIKGAEAVRLSQLLSEGKTIEAIKLVRALHDIGLREAKDIVEKIQNSAQRGNDEIRTK